MPRTLLVVLLLLSLGSVTAQESDSDIDEPLTSTQSYQTITFYVPSVSNVFNTFDPFSFFDLSLPSPSVSETGLEIDLDLEREADYFSFQEYFWSFPSLDAVFSLWASEASENDFVEEEPETEQDSFIFRESGLYMSCSTCNWLSEKLAKFVDYSDQMANSEFLTFLETECFELGLPRSYCDLLIFEIVPEMLEWIDQGNSIQEYCNCFDEGTTGSSPEIPSDETTNSETPQDDTAYLDLSRAFIVLILCALVFGMSLMSIRICLSVREKTIVQQEIQALIQRDEELAQSSLPTYSELEALHSDPEPPKYAFSAQDAAVIFHIDPPQYSPNPQVSQNDGSI